MLLYGSIGEQRRTEAVTRFEHPPLCFEPPCFRRVTFDEVGDARARPAAKQQDRAVGECDGAMPHPRLHQLARWRESGGHGIEQDRVDRTSTRLNSSP